MGSTDKEIAKRLGIRKVRVNKILQQSNERTKMQIESLGDHPLGLFRMYLSMLDEAAREAMKLMLTLDIKPREMIRATRTFAICSIERAEVVNGDILNIRKYAGLDVYADNVMLQTLIAQRKRFC